MSINPKIKEALDEHVDWVEQVTELAANDNWKAVQASISGLEDEQLRGMVYVLVLARGADLRETRKLAANWNTAPFN
jgi:hypothetical protein